MPLGFPCCPTASGGKGQPLVPVSRGQGLCGHGPSTKDSEACTCPQHHPAHPTYSHSFLLSLPWSPSCPSPLIHSYGTHPTCPLLPHYGVPLPVSATLRSDKEQYLSAWGQGGGAINSPDSTLIHQFRF